MEKIIQQSCEQELHKWSLIFKQKSIEESYQKEEKIKRSKIHIGFAYVLVLWSLLFIIYEVCIKKEFRYTKFFVYYGNNFTFSCLYILVNYYKPYLYNISHIIFIYAYTLNVTWGIYDQDFLQFDDRKTISYGYINAFLLCSCIEGGNYVVKSFLFVTVGFLFILSDSYSDSNFQTTNLIRYIFPSVLYCLKLRHEEIIKRQIYIQTRHVIDWANMIHKQLPTPFVIGKFNKKEERLEYYSSNLVAEKQLKITDNETFHQFLENCFINDYFMRQKKHSLLTQLPSQLDRNSIQEKSSFLQGNNVRTEQNSLKWAIREKLFFLFTNKDPLIYLDKEVTDLPKNQTQAEYVQNREELLKENNQINKNLHQSNYSINNNYNQSNLQEDSQIKNKGLLKKQYILTQKSKNQTLQLENNENKKFELIQQEKRQKSAPQENLTFQKLFEFPKQMNVNSPSFQERYVSNQSYQDLEDITNQQQALNQIKPEEINKNQFNSNVGDQENFDSQINPTSKNKIDSETVLEKNENKQNEQKEILDEEEKNKPKLFKSNFLIKNNQQNQQYKLEQKLVSSQKQIENGIKFNQKINYNDNDQKQKLLNIDSNKDQDEAINVIYFYKKDGNESQKKYSLRQKYFKTSELYVVIILENESFKSKYEKEKRKNNILNAITSQQEDCVKESIQKIDSFIKQQTQVPNCFNSNQICETNQNQLLLKQNFSLILSTCANLFLQNETYKMFNSFLRKQSIDIYILKLNLFSTAQIIVNSLNSIYSNKSKSINIEIDKTDNSQNNSEIIIFSDLIKLKILFYNLFNYFLQSSVKSQVIKAKFSFTKSDDLIKSPQNQIKISVSLPNDFDQYILTSQNIFNLNYQSLYNDSQNMDCQYRPQWQLRTAFRILTLLGPYNKIQFTQEEKQTTFSFLLYQDIRILQKLNSEKKDIKISNQNDQISPHIQANNISKLTIYNKLDKKLLSQLNQQ